MKSLTFLAVAGGATSAAAQFGSGVDLWAFTIPTSSNQWEVSAEFRGDLPAGTTRIASIWSDASFTLTGNAPITITGWSIGYSSALFGDPVITGNGTNEVTFVGVMPASPLGTPDPSNPLSVIDFTYTGDSSQLRGEIVGQNSALFAGNPDQPFGSPVLYQDAFGNPGPLRAKFFVPPAPGTLAIAPLALVAAHRRRK